MRPTIAEGGDLVEGLEVLEVLRERSHHLLDGALGVLELLRVRRGAERDVDVDAVAQKVGFVVAVEDDSGTIEQRNVPIDLDFLPSSPRRDATCTLRVKPAVDETPTARERFRELIREDLPTFG